VRPRHTTTAALWRESAPKPLQLVSATGDAHGGKHSTHLPTTHLYTHPLVTDEEEGLQHTFYSSGDQKTSPEEGKI